MYFLLAISLCFAALLVFNWVATAAMLGAWRVIEPRTKNWSANRRVKLIFALRVLPTIGAFLFVSAFLLPAYFLFEPYNTKEVVTYKLALPALISAFGALLAFSRVGVKLWRTRRLVADWLSSAERVSVADTETPLFCIEYEFPLIAVVGVLRPKMFIARSVFNSLSEDEFRAAIAHEHGHLVMRDNLKRVVLGVCRDLLVVPINRQFDRLWSETAEAAADEYAVKNGDQKTALNLAAAIVKIARIAPLNLKPATLSGASLLTEQTGDLTWRVRNLLWLSEIEFPRVKDFWSGYAPKIYAVGLLLIGLCALNRGFLQNIHIAMEQIVHILQ